MIKGYTLKHYIETSGPGIPIGRAFDCQSNDTGRAVVQSPVRVDFFFTSRSSDG